MNKSFYKSLAAELNNRTKDIEPDWSFVEGYFHGGVTYQLAYANDEFPSFVKVRLVRDRYVRFVVTTCVNGEKDDVYEGTDRNTAIAFAIGHAVKIYNDLDKAFEHEGTWITDRTKSPCGRFELTPEESEKLYGKENG